MAKIELKNELWQLLDGLTETEKTDGLYCSICASLNDKELLKVVNNIKKRIMEAKTWQ